VTGPVVRAARHDAGRRAPSGPTFSSFPGAGLVYSIDRSRLPPAIASRVVELTVDDDVTGFLARAVDRSPSRARLVARALVRPWCSDFAANALVDTYRLQLLSAAQWDRLLGWCGGRLLDVGAGMGDVTLALAPCFDDVLAVETSAALVRRLRAAGLRAECRDLTTAPVPDAPYDAVALLNVLDRCARPRALLGSLRDAIVPDGRLIVSVPLPYDPVHYVGPRMTPPREPLRLGNGSWEHQAARLVERVLEPEGFALASLSRAPYLSEGDRQAPFYELDAAVLVLRCQG
jgi:SAM-dependent methyltransferase